MVYEDCFLNMKLSDKSTGDPANGGTIPHPEIPPRKLKEHRPPLFSENTLTPCSAGFKRYQKRKRKDISPLKARTWSNNATASQTTLLKYLLKKLYKASSLPGIPSSTTPRSELGRRCRGAHCTIPRDAESTLHTVGPDTCFFPPLHRCLCFPIVPSTAAGSSQSQSAQWIC